MNNHDALDWDGIVERLMYAVNRKSQKEIADFLGVPSAMISGWKKGKSRPSWELLKKVRSEAYVSWEWLLNGKSASPISLMFLHLRVLLNINKIPGDPLYKFIISALNAQFRYRDGGVAPAHQYDYVEASNRFLFIACSRNPIKWKVPDEPHSDYELRAKSILNASNTAALTQAGYNNSEFRMGYVVVDRVNRDFDLEGDEAIPLSIPQIEHIQSNSKQKPPAKQAEGKGFNPKIKVLLGATATIDRIMHQCLLEAALGQVSEKAVAEFFTEVIDRFNQFRATNDLPEEQQTTA